MGMGRDPLIPRTAASVSPPAVVILGGPDVVPPLMSALHASGVAATWAVDVRQVAHLLDVLPGSTVVVTDDSSAGADMGQAEVIDVRGVASSTNGAWADIVGPLIAGMLAARAKPSSQGGPAFADLAVDDKHWCVRYRGRALRLTDAQYRLLAKLVRSGNQLVCLQELAQDMFDSSHCERQRIHAHVKRLRVRLATETEGRFGIVAVRGLGYRLADNGEVPLSSTG
jgi:DNA-binding winged helix-turn-helix (wHTH) protein